MHQAEKQTNLCDGLVSGLDMIKTVMGQQWMPPSASVLLFTDGHPTHGRAPFFFKTEHADGEGRVSVADAVGT